MSETKQIASQIRDFSELVDDPEKWRVLVPEDAFDGVKGRLDTVDEGLGTEYDGITLCYTQHHDQARVEFKADLSDATGQDTQPLGEVSVASDDDRGLYEKYEVRKDGEPVESCFVLEPESDSAAREALIEYAEHTDDEELAADLRSGVADICTRGGSDGD